MTYNEGILFFVALVTEHLVVALDVVFVEERLQSHLL